MKQTNNSYFSSSRLAALVAGPLSFLLIWMLIPAGTFSPEAIRVLGLAAWMLIWWISEAVELPVTAILPMFMLPLLGITTVTEAAAPYSNPSVYLFMGGFIIALAMEKWQLHRRIALTILFLTGTSANGVLWGFSLATAGLSMWISNTATATMMLPIGTSVIGLLFASGATDANEAGKKNFATSLMLLIAATANIGGMATLIGTPPNSVFVGIMQNTFQTEVSFAKWLLIGLPFSAAMLIVAYILIVRVLYPNRLGKIEGGHAIIEEELKAMGPVSSEEKGVLAVFVITALLWIFRQLLNDWLSIRLEDPMIAMAGGTALFLIPAKKSRFLLVWRDTERLPWGILMLFGGGLAIAGGLEKTGMIDLVAQQMTSFSGITPIMLMLLLMAIVLFMTELMSNLALATVFIPVVGGIAAGLGEDLLTFTIPVTLASSCAFMLPMATPPNAIVFASGHIKVVQMMRAGIWLNLIGLVLLSALAVWAIPAVF